MDLRSGSETKASSISRGMLLAFVSDPLRRSIRNAHAQSGKAGLQLTFRAVPPGHSLPFGLVQHVFGGHRQVIRDRPLTRAATAGNRPDELHTHGVDLEVTGDADRPGEATRREPLAERCAQSISRIGQHTAEADTDRKS